jgi:hypothetical protein
VLDSDELRIGRREPFDDQDPEPESNETEKRNCPTDRIRITRSKTTTMMTTISKQTLQKQIDRSVSLRPAEKKSKLAEDNEEMTSSVNRSDELLYFLRQY